MIVGAAQCANKYSSDTGVASLRELIDSSIADNDYDSLLYACHELRHWYERTMPEIRNNGFVRADDYLQNLASLHDAIEVIESNPGWFNGDTEVSEPDKPSTVAKKKMVFVSHSFADAEAAEALVDLLRIVGLDRSNLFCSSSPGYGIPNGEDIFDFLKHCFTDYELFVLFLISKENYYSSPAALNEMGAAWVIGSRSTSILLPGMRPSDLRGVVTPSSASIVLANEDAKYRLTALKDDLLQFLDLPPASNDVWERGRDRFLATFCKISVSLTAEVQIGGGDYEGRICDLEKRVGELKGGQPLSNEEFLTEIFD